MVALYPAGGLVRALFEHGEAYAKHGSSPVPEGPGLGIEVDEGLLQDLASRRDPELPRHLGVLRLPDGRVVYTPCTFGMQLRVP